MREEVVVAGYRFAPNKATIVCEHVFGGGVGKLFGHDSDGDLQVTCGAAGHDWSRGKVVALNEALNWLPFAAELPTVAPGYAAERHSGVWVIEALVEPADHQQDY
ncbi:hypothetical protein [uncultured Sphingomonas sp.]|uniref:hypothetical protein n=1 Tax=uncultured Sphingomonas sp. TaxID=158754 RepID=UPI0035C9D268